MRELNILKELEKNPVVSQRELSNKFGIALGVTNACLKRMARRGWIRIMGLNHRKIRYYLTPQGFAEKAKLSLHLISWNVHHYAALKGIIAEKFLEMQAHGIERIVFYGIGDEMEIAYVTLQGVKLKLVGIVEDAEKMNKKEVFGFQLMDVQQVRTLKPDAILVTSLENRGKRVETLKKCIDDPRVRIWNVPSF